MRARLIFLALALITVVGVALLAARGDGGGPSATPQRVAAQRSAPIVKPARPSVRTRARVQLPGGSLRVKKPKLMAGADDQSLDLGVTIDRAAPGARVEVTLPQRFVGRSETGLRFAGDPRLSADADGRVQLAQAGRQVSLDVGRARAGDSATITIPRLALPAGTYKLPVTWRNPDGTVRRLPAARVAILAGTKETVGNDVDASSDSDEESETFDVVAPNDPQRVVVAANDIDDSTGRKGVFISSNGGHSFAGLSFPTLLDVPGSSTDQDASLAGDPILAADGAGNIWAGGLTLCDKQGGVPSRIFVVRIPSGSTSFQAKGVGLPFLHGGTGGNCRLLQDKPMMTFGGGRLYVTWDDPDPSGAVNVVLSSCDTGAAGGPARCDNADNWTAPAVVSGPPGSYITSAPAVGPDGKVYVAWWDYSATNAIRINACSASCTTTAGWPSPEVAAALDATGGDPVPFSCPIVAQPGGRAAPVPSMAFDATGRLYLAWSDLRAGSGTTKCTDAPTDLTWDSFVASVRSVSDLLQGTAASRTSNRQGTSLMGDSATAPNDATNSDDWFPWVAVDPSNGQAWVDVMSTQGDATRRTTHPYVQSVAPSCGTRTVLSAATRTSDVASDYSWDLPPGDFQNDYGDYTGLSAAGGFPYAVWTKRTGPLDDGDVYVFSPAPAGPGTTSLPPAPAAPSCALPSPPPSQSTEPPPSTAPAPAHPGLKLTLRRQRRASVMRHGLVVRPSCAARCRLVLTFVARTRKGSRTVERTLARARLTLTGARTVRLRLTRGARRLLRKTPTRRLALRGVATADSGISQTTTRRVPLR